VRGLMSLPEPTADYADQLAVHGRTRSLFDQIGSQRWPQLAQWDTVSMGMSQDLDAAIAAGSTLVRVGTAIFGPRSIHTG
jgi:PLP dependent protein